MAVDTKPTRQFLYTQPADCTGYFYITQIAGSNLHLRFEMAVGYWLERHAKVYLSASGAFGRYEGFD